MVAVISVDAYPFLAFSDLTCHLKETGIGIFAFLESNSPDILALCETNLDDSIDSGNFNVILLLIYMVLQFM